MRVGRRQQCLFGLAFLFNGLATAMGAEAPSVDPIAELMTARHAYQRRDLLQLDQSVVRLRNTLFAAYPRMWKIELLAERAEPAQLDAFFEEFNATPLADSLRAKWLTRLGQRRDWASYRRVAPLLVQETQALMCYRWHAQLALGTDFPDDALQTLWFSGRMLPGGCYAVLEDWQAIRSVSAADRWLRMRFALREARISKRDNLYAVQAANKTLPHAEQLDIKQLRKIYNDPAAWLARQLVYPTGRARREIALFALNRQAADMPYLAAQTLRRWQMQMPLNDRQHAWGLLAFWASYKHQPSAPAWWRAAGSTILSKTQLAWKVRAGLRQHDWPLVLEAIDTMPASVAKEPQWRYWHARALAALGQHGPAQHDYQALVGNATFYGLLAEEELGVPSPEHHPQYQPSGTEVAMIALLPGIQRALQLRLLGWEAEAKMEWNWAIREFDDKQLIAAAELARRDNWYDRAIYTAERTKTLRNYTLQYLSPYREEMREQAARIGLDESWVYGLIRQESRFVQVARSVVGATGLMQVMPATAAWIAKRIGFEGYQRHRIHEIETNILLGTQYLKYVLNLFGQPVLATAAYNAGPSRARAWLDSKPLEGAIYIETIPFDETRDYVKKVMRNAVYYATVLADPYIRLKQRLGVVPARDAARSDPSDTLIDTES